MCCAAVQLAPPQPHPLQPVSAVSPLCMFGCTFLISLILIKNSLHSRHILPGYLRSNTSSHLPLPFNTLPSFLLIPFSSHKVCNFGETLLWTFATLTTMKAVAHVSDSLYIYEARMSYSGNQTVASVWLEVKKLNKHMIQIYKASRFFFLLYSFHIFHKDLECFFHPIFFLMSHLLLWKNSK